MKEQFQQTKFSGKSLDLVAHCIDVVRAYQGMGLRLTLRQLYYQLVTKNLIANEERSYKSLGRLVSKARLAGLIDWAAIEDRVRVPWNPPQWPDIQSLVSAAIQAYRLPRWEDQDTYVELWVEKDALAGVLRPLADEYHVTMMVNRGYSSQSAMYESARRFLHESDRERWILLYLGDMDPSGEDMVRDIQDRLDLFTHQSVQVEVVKIALTSEQITQYAPPPNPTKMSDSRATEYVQKQGHSSWEVDALPPEVLQEIIRDNILAHLDEDLMEQIKQREEADRDFLRDAVRNR